MQMRSASWLVFLAAFLWGGWLWAASYCAKCGQKLEETMRFCPACGQKVAAAGKAPKPAASPPPRTAPVYESIEEANNYYALAEKERKSIGAVFLPHLKQRRYAKALELYLKILEKWPNSDKCELAAYWSGAIYESSAYRDYNKAVHYYRTVVAINPETTLDARYQIAAVTEERIQDYASAITLYEECVENARVQEEKEKAAKALASLRKRLEQSQARLKAME